MIKIFVGSSTAAKRQAKVLMDGYHHPNITFVPWWDEFRPGHTLLGELTRIKDEVQACLLLMSPEALSVNPKGTETITPNLNVLFEFGFFYSALGHEKVALVKYGALDLPSDLGGYIHVNGSKFFKPNAGVPIGKKPQTDLDRWFDALIS